MNIGFLKKTVKLLKNALYPPTKQSKEVRRLVDETVKRLEKVNSKMTVSSLSHKSNLREDLLKMVSTEANDKTNKAVVEGISVTTPTA